MDAKNSSILKELGHAVRSSGPHLQVSSDCGFSPPYIYASEQRAIHTQNRSDSFSKIEWGRTAFIHQRPAVQSLYLYLSVRLEAHVRQVDVRTVLCAFISTGHIHLEGNHRRCV